LAVTEIEGNILIQTFPFLFIFLLIAWRAASICLAVIVPDSIAFKPIVPKFVATITDGKLNNSTDYSPTQHKSFRMTTNSCKRSESGLNMRIDDMMEVKRHNFEQNMSKSKSF